MKEVLEFIRVEHTLFSLPFVLIGYLIASRDFGSSIFELLLIVIAAIGARGLAMALNRIIDKEIDSKNPRTSSRHLPSGMMSINTAWSLAGIFLLVLVLSAWMLNDVALKMVWLPVIAFLVYPYTKRISWICHFWIGFCLALAPAGAWVSIAADEHGWGAITGIAGNELDFLWFPEIFLISLGVAFWITSFDINYALMDRELDRNQGIHSFPAIFGHEATVKLSFALTIGWLACFLVAGFDEFSGDGAFRFGLWIPTVFLSAIVNLYVNTIAVREAIHSEEEMEKLVWLISMEI